MTGTDTGVGKTVAACGLVRALRRAGVDTGAFKPVETGVGEAGPLDAQALREAAGGTAALEEVCPFVFSTPAAPAVAARAEGREIDVGQIRTAYDRLAARHRAVVVEGAGGLLVPITRNHDMASLALLLELPLIVVARGSLGTINHTLLTLEVARARGLSVAGVVVSHSDPISAPDEQNLCFLRDVLADSLLAELPFAPGVTERSTPGTSSSKRVEKHPIERSLPRDPARDPEMITIDEVLGKHLNLMLKWLRD